MEQFRDLGGYDPSLPNDEEAAREEAARENATKRRRARLLRQVRLRRPLAWLILGAAPCAVIALDFQRRGERLLQLDAFHVATYLGAILESTLVWGALLYAAARRRGAFRRINAVLFVLTFTLAVGGQSYFYEQYTAYLNVDVSVFASNFADSVVNQLGADVGNYLAAKSFPFGLALVALFLARRVLLPPQKRAKIVGVLAPCVLVATFFIPTQHRHAQASTPDVLYLNAIGGLLRTQLGLTEQSHQERPRARASLPVPALKRDARLPPRNVLFVILESVRADSVCNGYDPACRRTAATNALLPERLPLNQMRALDSSTAISLAVLWTGLVPTASREALHTWPTIFDYARAAGYETAFWTSQNMMFGNARLWVKNLGVSKFASATDLEPTADLDMGAPEDRLAEHVKRELSGLREPFLAVIQLSNVHYPYFVDPAGPMPFVPWTTSKAPEVNHEFKNYYQNSIYQQDIHVAAMLRHLRASPAGARTVIVYTSDHAEAFREHGQMGHTFSVFDEEIKVPAWVDAPKGTLTEEERRNLASKRDAYLFHVDIAPTIIDLIGVDQASGIARYRAEMPGHSLLSRELTREALPMTNCAGVWSCAFENWGYVQENLKLAARSWDRDWGCYDVREDPLESHRLELARCRGLVERAQKTFGRLPGQGIERPK